MAYKYATFRELLYWSYANMQMLAFACAKKKAKYSHSCYAFRMTAMKKYMAGEMHISDLYQNTIQQMTCPHDTCWYCGKPIAECGALTADHIFPRAKGGLNISDNLIMVCRSCNSSKGKKGLLQWFYERGEFPPMRVLVHFLKLVNQYATDHDLLDKSLDEIAAMDLPFDFRLLPRNYPHPEDSKICEPMPNFQLKMLEPEPEKNEEEK